MNLPAKAVVILRGQLSVSEHAMKRKERPETERPDDCKIRRTKKTSPEFSETDTMYHKCADNNTTRTT